MRSLSEITEEIRKDWKKPYFGAVPYITTLADFDALEDRPYGPSCESGKEIILYFLSNASTWKGEVARRVKTELRAMLKEK